MAITRPKPKTIAEFVAGAPDAPRKGVRKGRKEQISLTIGPDLLEKLDAIAKNAQQSRAALINLAIFRLIQSPEWNTRGS
jgi:hypothetical protein